MRRMTLAFEEAAGKQSTWTALGTSVLQEAWSSGGHGACMVRFRRCQQLPSRRCSTGSPANARGNGTAATDAEGAAATDAEGTASTATGAEWLGVGLALGSEPLKPGQPGPGGLQVLKLNVGSSEGPVLHPDDTVMVTTKEADSK